MIEAFKSGHISVEFLSIIFGAGMLVNVPCYYSDMLMQKSDDVRMALYSCGWESHWDRQSRTLIFLLLTRVTRPVAMHTMFSNISLDGLTDVRT
ncbi:unnamed protein product [Leptosia nina]|uniref:Uncharacterized protein n=1 Tax=Leptosia nina TaxID=320188 RepID=A0AAV1JC97_9NEOP